MPKNSVCAVTLNTWGTHDGGGNGMMHVLDTKMFGGNPGHASLSVTFPVNAETTEWIRKYCLDPAIPFEKRKIVTQTAELDAQGKYSQQKDAAYEEEVYTVNFSWFPGEGGYALSQSLNNDSLNEREGIASEMAPRFREYLGQEQRIHKGKLGEQTIHYGVKSIAHERALNDDQKALINIRVTQSLLMLSNKSLEILADKFEKTSAQLKEREQRVTHLADKANVINNHSQTLLTLVQLTNDLKVNSFSSDQYSDQQKAIIEKALGAKLDSFPHATQAEQEAFICKIEAAQTKVRADVSKLKRDTPEKITKQYENVGQLTPNTIIALDKELPSWRQEIQYQDGLNLNDTQLAKLEKMVAQKSKVNTEQFEQLTEQSKVLSAKLGTNNYAKVAALNKIISEKQQEYKDACFLILGTPLDKELHHKALMIDKEINDLKSEVSQLKKTENYQYHHIQSTVIPDWQNLEDSLDELLTSEQNTFSNADGSAELSSSMLRKLDSAFEHLIDKEKKVSAQDNIRLKQGWKRNHIAPQGVSFNQITREEAVALKDYVKKQIVANKEKALAVQPSSSTIEQADFDSYLTTGAPPDNVIKMELDQSANFANGNPNGMNVEAMLREMHAITTEGKRFDLNSNNCSVTVGRVLAAGAKNDHLKSKFENKALGAIGNPQKVYNNAQKYSEAMKDPNDSFRKKIARFDPLKAAKGWCVKTLLVDKEASTGKKVLAGFAAVPVAIAQVAITGLKKITSPVKSFNELVKFNQYAQSRPSLGFKIGAAVLSAPAFAILAVPAAITAAKDKFNSALGSLSKSFSKRRQSDLSDNVDLQNADIGKGLTIEANIQSALKDSIVTISATNLKDALSQFRAALDSQNGPVVLDKKTESAVIKQIGKIKDPAKQAEALKAYDALCQESIARISAIQQPILAANGAAPKANSPQPAHPIMTPPSKPDDMVLVKPAEYAQQQQFYSVMPVLGKELAQQIESYNAYEPVTSHANQNDSGLPRTVDATAVENNEGYLASKAERDYIIDYFHKNSDAKELRGATFPDGHPLKGQPICEAFKDNHHNIYLMNAAILGKGGFGTVKAIQAIETPILGHGVVEKEFYVVKIQDIDNKDPDRTLNAIQGEMNINAQFGLHLGELVIEHNVIKQLPEYQLQSSMPTATSVPTQVNGSTASKAAVLDDIDGPAIASRANTTVDDDDGPATTTKINIADDDDDGPATTTKINIADDDQPSGTFQPQEPTEEKPISANFFANYKLPPVELPKPAEEKVKYTLEHYANLQPGIANINAADVLSSFDTLKFLMLFEKMTEQVEMVHAKGVLHRDIKAENFLYDAEKDEMRLIDFGCSKRIDDPTLRSPKKMCIGSAANFSPEHFHSDYKENISTKQDIYALARTFTLLMAKDMQKLNPSAYVVGVPTPEVPDSLREQLMSSFMQNFRFNNPDSEPRTKIMNDMLDLMNEMTNMRVNNRPEASDVRLRLQGLINDYKLIVAAENSQNNTAVPPAVNQASLAVAAPLPPRPLSAMEQNVQRNLHLLDQLASRHPDTKPLIDYAKQGLSDARDIDQTMTRLLAELSASKTPKNPEKFTADLVRTFDQMKKTPATVLSSFAAAEAASSSTQDTNHHQPIAPSFTSQFSYASNRAKPLLTTDARADISKNVQDNLHLLDALSDRFYVDGDRSKVPSIVKYIKGELEGAPNPEASMERLTKELLDDKWIKSRDDSPSFKEAVKEIFSQMKTSVNRAEEPSVSSAAIKL